MTRGALGPTRNATVAAPPVHRAFPLVYTAISPATTNANLIKKIQNKLI